MASTILAQPPAGTSMIDSADREEAGISALRSLLDSPTPDHIDQLEQRIADLELARKDKALRTTENAEVIADVFSLRGKDEKLGNALRPMVEKQFHTAARENVDFMAEALFPVLGPAVRKLVGDMLSPEKGSQDDNIEQIFLIDNPSGLPIHHLEQPGIDGQDADMVGGMLSAINSYVHDAFETKKFDALEYLRVGELTIWIEWGPQAILATVVRGNPPEELRPRMQAALEQLHRTCAEEITNYDGSDSGKEKVNALLNPILNHYALEAAAQRKKRFRLLFTCSLTLLTLVTWLAYSFWDGARWNGYLERVEKLPGVVILSNSRKISGYEVVGLRDPLSHEPLTFLNGTGIDPADIRWRWSEIASLDPTIVARRAAKILNPEPGVRLFVRDATLHITGRPSLQWLNETRPIALAITGINSISISDPITQ